MREVPSLSNRCECRTAQAIAAFAWKHVVQLVMWRKIYLANKDSVPMTVKAIADWKLPKRSFYITTTTTAADETAAKPQA